jgi:iron-sulfur cluster assembly accessory protein
MVNCAMIETTPNAVRHLRELLHSHGAPAEYGLRVAIERGGCAGLQYAMKIAAPAESDVVVQADGVRIFVAADCVPLLEGATLDYHESLTDAGFKIENPNASRSCGCGTSFELSPRPELPTR